MLTTAGFNRRMRKTACPVVWKGCGVQLPSAPSNQSGVFGLNAPRDDRRCSHPTLLGCSQVAWLGAVGGTAEDCRFYNGVVCSTWNKFGLQAVRPQQDLNFLLEPQGQGSLRPTLGSSRLRGSSNLGAGGWSGVGEGA